MMDEQPLTQREVGKFEQVLQDMKHRARNDRQIIILLQNEIEELQKEFVKMKTRVYTAGTIIVVVGSTLAWLIEVILLNSSSSS